MGAEVTMIDRRRFVATGSLGAFALTLPFQAGAAAGPTPRIVDLAVSATRSTKLVLWTPAAPKGVALLSTGHGSWPERYAALAALLVGQGFAVLSPVHVDSVRYPERDKFTLEAGFPERLADMRATAGYAAKAFPGLPVIAAGHSFGTLTALCLGGALAGMGPFRDPAVKAVLGFSTPGRIPGLIQPTAYATVATPLMIVTGTEDLVPGFVTDPADHLFPARTVRVDAYSLVLAGGGHDLVGGEGGDLARAMPAARLFLEGYGLDRARSRTALARWKASDGDLFSVRKGQA